MAYLFSRPTECMELRWQYFAVQSLDFCSSNLTLDRSPRNLKIDLIQLTFMISCWPLWLPFIFPSFLSFFFFVWNFFSFRPAWIWILYRFKANILSGICFLYRTFSRMNPVDCFHTKRKSASINCGAFCHFIVFTFAKERKGRVWFHCLVWHVPWDASSIAFYHYFRILWFKFSIV